MQVFSPARTNSAPVSFPMRRKPLLHFSGETFDRFDKKASPFDAEFSKHYKGSIQALMQESATEKNLIGQGTTAKVYRIPKLPDFVLRIWNNVSISQLSAKMERTNWDILPIDVGQPVASFNNKSIEINRYQTGRTTGLHIFDLLRKYNFRELFAEQEQKPLSESELAYRRPLYVEHLKYTAAMPQKAYDSLAHKMEILNEYSNLFFDPNIRNILADKDKETFNIVDLTSDYGLGPHKNVSGLAGALIDSMFVNLDESSIDENGEKPLANVANDESLASLRHSILEKTFLATYRTGLRLPEADWPEIPLPRQEQHGKRKHYLNANYICKVSGFDWQKVKTLLRKAKADGMPETEFLRQLKSCKS